MDLNELQSVQSRERQTDSLQQLRATFYQDAAEFIQSLEAERDAAAERADDPWNAPEVGRLNDDIDTAEDTVEAIYERRVGKIVKMASLAAADMPTDDEGLTEEEQALFDQLVAAIEQNREGVFAILDGEKPAIDPTDAPLPTGTKSPVPEPDTESTPADDPPAPPAETESPAATPDDDHREVPPDVGPPGETGPDHDSSEVQAPDPDVGAADLMGSGESNDTTEQVASGRSTDSAPVETDSHSQDPQSRDPASTDTQSTDTAGGREPAGDVGSGQPVRDGGAVESRPADAIGGTESASAGADTPGTPGPDSAAPGPGADLSSDSVTSSDSAPSDSRSETTGSAAASGDDPAVDRAMVRITDDVGPIYGVEGREYDLTTDDVVTLPEANAGPLLKQGAAERMD